MSCSVTWDGDLATGATAATTTRQSIVLGE